MSTQQNELKEKLKSTISKAVPDVLPKAQPVIKEQPTQLKNSPKQPIAFVRAPMALYPLDNEKINQITIEQAKKGIRLNRSQAVRIALRSINPLILDDKIIQEVLLEDGRLSKNK